MIDSGTDFGALDDKVVAKNHTLVQILDTVVGFFFSFRSLHVFSCSLSFPVLVFFSSS